MIEKEGQKLYTIKEVMDILMIGRKRIMNAMDEHVLIPTDIQKWRGYNGFRYLFSEDEINRYADKIGLEPYYDRVEHEKKVMEARREVRKVVDPTKRIDDGTLIIADNVKAVFDQIQQDGKQEFVSTTLNNDLSVEPVDMFVIKAGKAFIVTDVDSTRLQLTLSGNCFMDREEAIRTQEAYGGVVLQIFMKEAVL